MNRTECRQHVVEKLRVMRERGEVWLTWGTERLRLRPPSPEEIALGGRRFVYKNRSRVYLGELGRRKGTGPLQTDRGTFIRDANVLACIVETRPRTSGDPP